MSLTITGVRAFSLTQLGDLLAVLGHLSHGGAHAALAHAVGATEVQFQAVGAGVFCALHDVVPGLALALDHQRGDDHMLGIAPLDLGNFLQVDRDGPVGDELDVVEAHHAAAFPIDRGVARAHVGDGLADGLPHRATPSGVEGAHDLLAAVGGGAEASQKGFRHFDAAEGSFKRWQH